MNHNGQGTVTRGTSRGKLLRAGEVAELIGRSTQWVRCNVPHRIKLGHRTLVWYEQDVLRWLDEHLD